MSSSNVVLIILSIVSVLASIVTTFFASIVSKERQQMKLEEQIRKMSKIEVSQESLNKIGAQLKALSKNNEQKIIRVEGKRIFPSTGTDS